MGQATTAPPCDGLPPPALSNYCINLGHFKLKMLNSEMAPLPVTNIRELSGAQPHSTKLPDFGTGVKNETSVVILNMAACITHTPYTYGSPTPARCSICQLPPQRIIKMMDEGILKRIAYLESNMHR